MLYVRATVLPPQYVEAGTRAVNLRVLLAPEYRDSTKTKLDAVDALAKWPETIAATTFKIYFLKDNSYLTPAPSPVSATSDADTLWYELTRGANIQVSNRGFVKSLNLAQVVAKTRMIESGGQLEKVITTTISPSATDSMRFQARASFNTLSKRLRDAREEQAPAVAGGKRQACFYESTVSDEDEATLDHLYRALLQFPELLARCGWMVGLPGVQIPIGANAIFAEPLFTGRNDVSATFPIVPTALDPDGSVKKTPIFGPGLVTLPTDVTKSDDVGRFDYLCPVADVYALTADQGGEVNLPADQDPTTLSARGGALTLTSTAIANFVARTHAMQKMISQSAARDHDQGKFDRANCFDVESLTRGFAADLCDDGEITLTENWTPSKPANGGVFQPLCERTVKVSRERGGLERKVADFAQTAPLGVNTTTAKKPNTLRVAQGIYRYAGTSPVLPKTMQRLNRGGIPLAATYGVGPMPSIYFGHQYRTRLRSIDVGGSVVAPIVADLLSTEGSDFVSNAVVAGRFETIQPPVLAAQMPLETAGDRLDNLCVRLEPSYNFVPADAVDERDLLLFYVPKELARLHGKFKRSDQADAAVKRYLHGKLSGAADLYPDPMSIGVSVTFTGPNGVASAPLRALFPGEWPDIKGLKVRLVVVPSLSQPWTAELTGSTFVVKARPGITVKARMHALIDATKLHHLALLMPRFYDGNTPAVKANNRHRIEALETAKAGGTTIVNPVREFTLSAATRTPVFVPIVHATKVEARVRKLKDAAVTIDAYLPVSSADQVEVLSEWPAWRRNDDGVPERYDAGRVVARIDAANWIGEDGHPLKMNLADQRCQLIFSDALDTTHREVRYRLRLRSRYVGLFAPDEPSRFTIEWPSAVTAKADALTLRGLIKNSEAPKKPDVHSVRTTYSWQDRDAARVRDPGTIRIYFRDEAFSTGDDESIAIILSVRNVFGRIPPVSFIGEDPLYALAGGLTKAEIPAEWFHDQLPTPETGEVPVDSDSPVFAPSGVVEDEYSEFDDDGTLVASGRATILRYCPRFDAIERKWYIDLSIHTGKENSDDNGDTPTYMPFAGFSIARFQPSSIKGYHFSEIHAVPAIQLLPRRTMTVLVSQVEEGKWRVSATVAGTQFPGGARSRIEAFIDELRFSQPGFAKRNHEIAWTSSARWIFTEESRTSGTVTFGTTLNVHEPRGFRVRVIESELYANDLKRDENRPRYVYMDVTDDLITRSGV